MANVWRELTRPDLWLGCEPGLCLGGELSPWFHFWHSNSNGVQACPSAGSSCFNSSVTEYHSIEILVKDLVEIQGKVTSCKQVV